jgi:hypothetical protein
MKTTLIAVTLLMLPAAAAATIAMEPQQAMPPPHGQAPAQRSAHHQLFTVKYVLHLAPPDGALPQVVVDKAPPEIAPPGTGSVPVTLLGAIHRDPNTIICYGWGCESDER